MKVIHMAFTDEEWEVMAEFYASFNTPLSIEEAEATFPEMIVKGLKKGLAEIRANAKAKGEGE